MAGVFSPPAPDPPCSFPPLRCGAAVGRSSQPLITNTWLDLGPASPEPEYFKEQRLYKQQAPDAPVCFAEHSRSCLAEITADYYCFPKASEIFVAPSTILNHKLLYCLLFQGPYS